MPEASPRNVVVTGGGTGIGRAIAAGLLSPVSRYIVCGQRPEIREGSMAMQGDVRAGGWARRGRRLLLGLGVLLAGGFAVLFLAAFALVSGHVAEALELYERVIQLNPLDALSLEAISDASCAADRLSECLQYRLKLQQLHPDYGGINSSVGMARVYLGDLNEALSNMEQEPEEDRRLAGLEIGRASCRERV